jgi:hypothetical protein
VFLDAITHGWVGPPRTGGLLLLATCAVACASTPPAPFTPPDPCTRVVPAIDGPVFTGPEGRLGRPFSLVVPEAFSPVDGMGIDSEVRLWVDGSGNAIFYDYSASISQPFLRSHLARYLEGFYPASADTSDKAHLGSKGVSCQNEGSTARSSSVRR